MAKLGGIELNQIVEENSEADLSISLAQKSLKESNDKNSPSYYSFDPNHRINVVSPDDFILDLEGNGIEESEKIL